MRYDDGVSDRRADIEASSSSTTGESGYGLRKALSSVQKIADAVGGETVFER